MKNLTVHLDDKPIYDIVYEESFDALPSMMKELGYSNRKICVVSESHVASLYLDAILLSIKDACTYTTSFVFPEGEASKNLNVVRDLYTHLIKEKFDRNDVLIALGGGVVGDLTGYAAATYLRGIDFIQIPTSLLSQVDSSIGGKTGVDFDSYKNMVGAYAETGVYEPVCVKDIIEPPVLFGYGRDHQAWSDQECQLFYMVEGKRSTDCSA